MKMIKKIHGDAISEEAKPVSIYEALQSGEVKQKRGRLAFDPKSSVTAFMQKEVPFEFTDLLKYASSSYNISDDPKDYVVVPVPIIISDVPNRNGVAFPAQSLASFSTEHGMPFFKTWIGKPTFEEHKNENPIEAKGIILDAVMNKVKSRPGFFKVVTLLAFDRTKDRVCYDKIVSGKSNAYSMGAYVGTYKCSLCGAAYLPGAKMAGCRHIDPNGINFWTTPDNKLVYKEVWQPQGFEVSRVDVPAYRMAVSDFVNVLEPQLKNKETPPPSPKMEGNDG